MEEPTPSNKIFFLIVVAFVVLFGLVVVFNLMQKKPQPQSEAPTSTPKPLPTLKEPPPVLTPRVTLPPLQSKKALPTYPPDRGQGVDLESPVVQTSIAEIEKLYPHLPYVKDLELSTGLSVSIVIPAKEPQESPWILLVQIFGIDYNIPPESDDYQLMKASFLEAASSVFDWMNSNQVDPEKIIISWGDRAFIQNRAEEWLR